MKENFLSKIIYSLCLCIVISIQLLNKMEDSFAFIYEQPLNENVLRDPLMLLNALLNVGFNVVSTEIVFGCIFKRNVLGGLIGDSAQVLHKISRSTWKPLRTFLKISLPIAGSPTGQFTDK